MELQVPDRSKPDGYASYGWTLINLFDYNTNQLNKGRFKLPIYKPNTMVDLDVRDIHKLKPMGSLILCLRIAVPKDEVYQYESENEDGDTEDNGAGDEEELEEFFDYEKRGDIRYIDRSYMDLGYIGYGDGIYL